MQKRSIFFMAAVFFSGVLSAEPFAGLQEQIDRFRSGRRVWNAEEMQSARDGFAEVVRRQPGEYIPLYWQSVCEFYLMLFYGLEESAGYDPDRAERLLDDAEKTMKAAVAARPQDAECRALLSSVYGFKIKANALTAVWNGPKVLSLQSDALDHEPDNPRVLYIIGAGYFRAPRIFRNIDKARELLGRAERLFSQTPQGMDPAAPQWGREECHGLLGDLRRLDGKTAEAKRHYQAALRLNPDYMPARQALKEIQDEK